VSLDNNITVGNIAKTAATAAVEAGMNYSDVIEALAAAA
jgi:hypothetical protein